MTKTIRFANMYDDGWTKDEREPYFNAIQKHLGGRIAWIDHEEYNGQSIWAYKPNEVFDALGKFTSDNVTTTAGELDIIARIILDTVYCCQHEVTVDEIFRNWDYHHDLVTPKEHWETLREVLMDNLKGENPEPFANGGMTMIYKGIILKIDTSWQYCLGNGELEEDEEEGA